MPLAVPLPVMPDDDQAALTLYSRTSQIWDAMYKDCKDAKKSIDLEQYIFNDDASGHRFLKLFAEKARQGVEVNLLVDDVGSMGLNRSPAIKELYAAGGHIKFYNPLGPFHIFTPARWYPRCHTKTMLIDNQIGYVGSACVDARMKDWTDLQMRFTGDLVQDVKKNLGYSRSYLEKAERQIISDKPFQYAVSFPHLRRNPVYLDLLRAIGAATDSIYLVTPYFLPPWRLRRALYRAVRRGVSVQIMVSETTDVRVADLVTRSYLKTLLRHGLEIFLYKEGMLHAKYTAIDQTWATIGSTNLDYLSLRKNREGNVIIRDAAAVISVRENFERDLKKCFRVTKEFCNQIPLHERMIGILGRIIKRVL